MFFPPRPFGPPMLVPPDRRGRQRRRFRPRLSRFEDRTLPSVAAADVLAGTAAPIALGTPTSGTRGAGAVRYFRVDPAADGRLIAQVHVPGGTTRLTVMGAQCQTLLTSDGLSPAALDPLIDLHVPAGPDYLEVENLGIPAVYTL